jgi:hypothetical protein
MDERSENVVNCTHPVIYMIDGKPTCHLCGVVISMPAPVAEADAPELKDPPKPTKKGKKTKAD